MASIKVLKKLHQQNNDRRSLVKDLIALRPITPVEVRKTHPLQTLYQDSNAPPAAIDQFAPYLARKLNLKRNGEIDKAKQKKKSNLPTFFLTNSLDAKDQRPKTHLLAKTDPNPKCSELNSNEEEETVELQEEPQKEQTPIKENNYSNEFGALNQHLNMEQTFDKIAANAASTALHRLIESSLQSFFSAENVLFYHDIASVKVLYCPSTTVYCPHGTGLVGYTQFSRKTITLNKASEHVAYNLQNEGNQCPPDSRVLLFPLFDSSSHVRGVCEVIRSSDSPAFNEHDMKFVEYFQTKCRMYARWLFQPILDDAFASNLIIACRIKQFVEVMREKLTQLFSCRGAEIWSYDQQSEIVYKYTAKSDSAVPVIATEAGIPGFSLRQQVPVSCIAAHVHSAFNAKADGNGDHSVLSIPIRDPDTQFIYAIVLRGKRIPHFFTDNDEKTLVKISPYIISSLKAAEIIEKNHKTLKDSIHQQKRLRALLDVAEALSGQLRMDVLIPNIMQRACELVKADRCSLFMVNETRDKLVTSFQGGLANSIEIPLNKGIVGFTATTGEILNIEEAYDDPRFNRATDLSTGYRTQSLLCVPIFDDKKEIRGVTEMINKLDGVFTKEDEKLIQIFNVFCGISLENARLYRASIDLSMQLRSFFEISTSLAQPQTIKKMMEEILRNTRKVFGAVRALLFLIENNGINYTPYVQDEDIEAKLKKVQQRKKEEAEDLLGVKRSIISKLMKGKRCDYDDNDEKEEEARNRLVEHAITNKESVLENDPDNPERSLIIVPILSSDRAVLGAVMMQWKKTLQKFTFDEQKLLESYSVFLSLSIERSKLKNMAQLGSMEVEMQTWISPEERNDTKIPAKLKMTDDERNLALISINYDSSIYQAHGLFNVVFNLFDLFKICDTFKIDSETLFTFLYEVKQNYNPVKYHNWNHAVDSAQFLAYQLYFGNLQSVFTPFEIIAMFSAILCHDVNHDGFSTSYNSKAEIPLGILFNNQSVLETHHCTVAISILTKEESNIFRGFDDDDMKKMWSIFVALILATDMAKHFDILEEAQKILESGKRWQDSEDGRLTIMKVIIKAADLASSVRNFPIADKNAEIVCEEFFRQGEIERCPNLVFIDDNYHDRDHLDKTKSVIPFYQEIAKPLFEVLGKAIPTLSSLVQHVQLNISKWEEKDQKRIEKEEEKIKEQIELIKEETKLIKEQEDFANKIDSIDIDGQDIDIPDVDTDDKSTEK